MAAIAYSSAVPLLVVLAATLIIPQSNGQPSGDLLQTLTDLISCDSNREWMVVCGRCQVTCGQGAATPCNTDHVCMPRCMCPDALPVWDGRLQECIDDLANCAAPGTRSIFRPQDYQTDEPLEVGPCHGGQLWLECGSRCPKVCNEPEQPACEEQCVRGCQCAPGMEWHERLQHCYYTPMCPPDNTKDACFGRDLVFALDASGSVARDDFEKMKRFLRLFVDKLLIGREYNQVSIITYSTEAFVHAKLGEVNDKTALLAVIDNLQHIGQRTNTSGAIRAIHNEFKREAAREGSERLALVTLDGKSNTDADRLFSDLKAAKKDRIKFMGFGCGPHADMYEMSIVADLPLFENALFSSYNRLLTDMDYVFDQICKNNARSTSEVTYNIGKTPDIDLYAGNIIFVVDAAPSLSKTWFDFQLKLIKEVVKKLQVQTLRKFAVVQFGAGSGITHLPFEAYESINGFMYQIDDRIRYNPQDVDLGAGVDHIENMLDEALLTGIAQPSTLKPQVVLISSVRNAYNVDLFQSKLEQLKLKYADLHVMPVQLHTDLTAEQQVMASILFETMSKDHLELLTKIDSNEEVTEQLSHYIAWLIAGNAALPIFMCDFEKVVEESGQLEPSMCDLHQIQTNDDFDWLVSDGATPSQFTGPSKAAMGSHYAYIEATDRQAGDTAVLLGFAMGFYGFACVHFKYNMHGWHTGSLEIVHYLPGYPEWTIWRMSGEQGDEWHEGAIHTFVLPNSRFGFRATVGAGYSSDIAIDALTLTVGPCAENRQFVRDERMTMDMMNVNLHNVRWYGGPQPQKYFVSCGSGTDCV